MFGKKKRKKDDIAFFLEMIFSSNVSQDLMEMATITQKVIEWTHRHYSGGGHE